MDKATLVGKLKSGENVFKYPDSELSPYVVEKDYRYLVLPTEEELNEIMEMVKNGKETA
jgi:hypothetical protein